MADEKESIIFEAIFDADKAEVAVVSFKKQLIELKGQKADLDKQFKSGAIDIDSYTKALHQIETETKAAKSGLQEQTRALDNDTKARKAAEGSIIQMRMAITEMTKSFVGFSKAERESAKGIQLQKKILETTNTLKDLESSLGNNTRNVGNYIKQFNIAGISVGQVQEALKAGGEGFQVFTKGIGTTRGALIALGAVPILLLLTGLIAFLKRTEEGTEALERGVAFLTGGLDSLAKGLAPLGKLLYDTFTNPLETLKKLIAGTDEYKVSLGDVAANAVKAGEANAEYTATLQDIEDQQQNMILQQAKVGLQVDLALLQVKDRSKSEKERLGVLAAAGKAELELSRITIAQAQRAADALRERNKVLEQTAKLNNDQIAEQQTADAKVVEAQRANLEVQQKIQNRSSALIEQEASARKAASDKATAAAKKAAEDRVSLAEIELIAAKRKGQDTLAIEENIIALTAKAQAIGANKNAVDRKLAEAQTNAAILALRLKHASELTQLTLQGDEDRTSAQLALSRKGSEDEQKLAQQLLLDKLTKDKAAAVDAAEADVKLREGLTKRLRLLDANYTRDSEASAKQFASAEIDRADDLGKKRAETELALNGQSLANTIAYQKKLIDLEESHSLAILKLDEVSEEDRLVKLNAIQAKAIAARRELNKKQEEAERKDNISTANTAVIKAREGSKAELVARLSLLREQEKEGLAQEDLSQAARLEIIAKYEKAANELRKDYQKKRLNGLIDDIGSIASQLGQLQESQFAAQSKRLEKNQSDALKAAGLNAEARTAIEIDFNKKKEKLDKEAAEKRRKIATIENIINTAKGITAAYAESGPIVGTILAALVLANGLAQQAVIASQTFRKGGVVDGPSHEQGGVKYRVGSRVVELEGGEAVINKRSTAAYRDVLSQINQAYGGVGFAGGSVSVSPKMALGGITAMQNVASGQAPVDYGQLRAFIHEAVQASPPIFVKVQDINSEQARLARPGQKADF